MHKRIMQMTVICLSLTFVGCVSTKDRVFENTEMMSMKDIYSETFGSTDGASDQLTDEAKKRLIHSDTEDLADYTRLASTELATLFPELPNPKLSMYVFPHITISNLPVPGYSTSFYMYKTLHFGLPGEIRELSE